MSRRVPPTPEAALREAAAGLDRRGFLRLAGAAAAGGLLPTGCGAAPAGLGPPPGVQPRVLSARTWAVFNAATRIAVGPGGARLIDEGAVRPAALADAWLAKLGAAGEVFQNALWTLELGVWPLVAKLRPFTSLDDPEQHAVLAELLRSRWALKRQLFAGVKTLACLAFYAHPASHALIGYPGPFGGRGVTIADAMTYAVDP